MIPIPVFYSFVKLSKLNSTQLKQLNLNCLDIYWLMKYTIPSDV